MQRSDPNWKFDFGIHQLRSIRWVFENDPRYIECLQKDGVMQFYGEALAMIEGRPWGKAQVVDLPHNVVVLDEYRKIEF